MKKFFHYILSGAICLIISFGLYAKSKPVVKVKVNDKVITTQDLINKAKIFLKISRLSVTKENESDFKKRIIESSIDELIKLETIRAFEKRFMSGKKLTPDTEIEKYLDDFLITNKCNKDEFLKYLQENNISKDSVYEQIEANLSWVKYIQEMFGHFVQVSETEIEAFLENLKVSMKSKVYNLSRIVVSVDSKHPEKAKKKIDEVLLYLRKGAEFSVIAQNFSDAQEGVRGGYVGSVNERQLSKPEREFLNGKQIGTVTDPIFIRNSYIVYKINDISEAGDNGYTELKLQRIEFPNIPESEMEYRARAVVMAAESDINAFLINIQMDNSVVKGKDETVILEEAVPEIRSFLSSLVPGKISQPIPLNNGFFVFFLKEKKKIPSVLPKKEQVRAAIANKKLQAVSMQQLEEERKNAMINIL